MTKIISALILAASFSVSAQNTFTTNGVTITWRTYMQYRGPYRTPTLEALIENGSLSPINASFKFKEYAATGEIIGEPTIYSPQMQPKEKAKKEVSIESLQSTLKISKVEFHGRKSDIKQPSSDPAVQKIDAQIDAVDKQVSDLQQRRQTLEQARIILLNRKK